MTHKIRILIAHHAVHTGSDGRPKRARQEISSKGARSLFSKFFFQKNLIFDFSNFSFPVSFHVFQLLEYMFYKRLPSRPVIFDYKSDRKWLILIMICTSGFTHVSGILRKGILCSFRYCWMVLFSVKGLGTFFFSHVKRREYLLSPNLNLSH